MSQAVALSHDEGLSTGVESGKLGLWVFLASEVMFFAAMIGSYVVLRLGSPESWPANAKEILDLEMLGFNTFLLICSSVTMVLGLQAIQRNERKKTVWFLLATSAMGVGFLVIKGVDYGHLFHHPDFIADGNRLFRTCFMTLTGFHGLHVAGGVVSILVMVLATLRGKFSAEHHVGIENVGLYWHFVDLVWIVLFAILCLV